MTRLNRGIPNWYVWVEYQGGSSNHYILSPTKQVRHYGYGKKGKILQVHPDDMEAAPKLFRAVDPSKVAVTGAVRRPVSAFTVPPHLDPANFPAKSPPPVPGNVQTVDSIATLMEPAHEPVQEDSPTPQPSGQGLFTGVDETYTPADTPKAPKRLTRRAGKGKPVRRAKK
jgi:hypothetical protein